MDGHETEKQSCQQACFLKHGRFTCLCIAFAAACQQADKSVYQNFNHMRSCHLTNRIYSERQMNDFVIVIVVKAGTADSR
ncbi:MAG: hypothetical protein ATN35_09805 [Epulopiscium sp. Nele67-Bin004]|nr:MAG: hypothetical protein ATN35_09805 [Epulopiscium sp. Nele67-Bin004]